MLSLFAIAAGYASLVAMFGWFGLVAIAAHLIIMTMPLGRKKGKKQ